MGLPKAQLRDARGVPFLDRAVGLLLEGGCASVTVVLGAAADEAVALLDEAGWTGDPAVTVVRAGDWDEGMGASLRQGLAALGAGQAGGPVAVLVTLVDLPDVTADVVGRLLAGGAGADTLARAAYGGEPGHPVLLGRAHWAGIAEAARGDRGARDYLAQRPVRLVECGDLATGRDVDRPGDLA
ncbi:NTP transferase domain-containing protein [Nocardioides mesophilus]|uniref:NTP transferase domain-containing protein n=2 Tax=Nocardioides mesophilus TaxID=433659 RepID=A0A7G9RGX4_9ACTN|nr:NTP transferase domain-containing protein [Nocardioides mesophilus]